MPHGKAETKGHMCIMYIYMQVLNMHGTYVILQPLIHLIAVLKILLYQELEIYKYFILPKEDEEMGTNDISWISE